MENELRIGPVEWNFKKCLIHICRNNRQKLVIVPFFKGRQSIYGRYRIGNIVNLPKSAYGELRELEELPPKSPPASEVPWTCGSQRTEPLKNQS